jgi:hypothetical protein
MPGLGLIAGIIGVVVTIAVFGTAALLGRLGWRIPAWIDTGYQVFICALMAGVVVNIIAELLR